MTLLGKSRKKYHGSIIKDYRSIIKDSRNKRKTVKTLRKDSLNFYKRQFKHRKEVKEYCPKTCPTFGHPLPALRATVAQRTGYRCP